MAVIVSDYVYQKAKSLGAVFKLIEKEKDYSLLAGGTDLLCNLKEGFINPKLIVDIKGIKGLNKIVFKDNELTLGSLVTFTELLESRIIKKHFPLLWEAALTVASVAVRNRATMAGNICSAVPCMDSGAPLMVYETHVIVKNKNEEKSIPIEKWFVAPRKTALQKGEIVIGLKMKLPNEKNGTCYVKLGRYEGEDLAQATIATIALPDNHFRISFGSVAPTPVRAHKVENFLAGKELNAEVIEQAKKLVKEEIAPITDIRSSKEYRLHMCEVMLERSLLAARERLTGKGPRLGTTLI